MSDPNRQRDIEWLRLMVLIRRFEERIDALYAEGAIGGTSHLYVGQEACAVGAVAALGAEDLVVSNHRGHGHLLAKGGDPDRLMAELLGKETGYCRGKGGSQHVMARDIGFMGTNGITGGGIPVATGLALAQKLRRTGRIVMCFFGDGAQNQGTFHESLNMAGLWRLPIVYVCENNLYGMSAHVTRHTAVERIHQRAAAYAMRGEVADGMDAHKTFDVVAPAVESVRAGGTPVLVELLTYRFLGHSKSDLRVYRSAEEEESWRRRDPILLLRKQLIEEGVPAKRLDAIETEAAARVEEAFRKAEAAPAAPPEVAVSGVTAPRS